jgi:hypothetical protein
MGSGSWCSRLIERRQTKKDFQIQYLILHSQLSSRQVSCPTIEERQP